MRPESAEIAERWRPSETEWEVHENINKLKAADKAKRTTQITRQGEALRRVPNARCMLRLMRSLLFGQDAPPSSSIPMKIQQSSAISGTLAALAKTASLRPTGECGQC